VVDLGSVHRCLSSAVLGGGLGWVRTWLNLQVERGYDCADPEGDLLQAAEGLEGPVVGMLTAAPVSRFVTGTHGRARAVMTVGLRHPIVAASGTPRAAPPVGTINGLAVVDVPFSDAGLVDAHRTAVEAKAQALAAARVHAATGDGFATGTATDAFCIACPPGGTVPYAGPATPHGQDLARAVYTAVLEGARRGQPGLRRGRRDGGEEVHEEWSRWS
jgi:adenosylcobinamide amidohydrolase